MSVEARPNAFVATNISLGNLITIAYRVPSFRIVGGPDWIWGDRFDVNARMPDSAKLTQLSDMLTNLLADRFVLRAHPESREQPIYALILAGSDGQLGPELRRSSVDCAAVMATRASPAVAPAGPEPTCGSSAQPGHVTIDDMPLSALANLLSPIVERVVIDRTDLTGTFDADLRFASFGARGPASELPSIFTALQDQLGLRLEPGREPIEVLAIDSANPPVPD